ncbi:MAG: DUF2723 domain-containing protein [Candidatus Coatesbacteria bacterium]
MRLGLAALFLGTFGLYLHTLCGSYDVVDGGEFLAAGSVLGVAHPPGYPLFVLVERLLLVLPAGGPEFRMALVAPLAGGAAAVAVACALSRVWGPLTGGLVAAAIAVEPSVWAQGTGLKDATNLWHLWAGAIVCGALARQAERLPQGARGVLAGARGLLVAALGLGLAAANLAVGAAALAAAAGGALLLASDVRRGLDGRRVALAAVVAGLAISAYLVLPIRAAAPPAVCWGDWHRLTGVGRVVDWLLGWRRTEFFHMDWAGWRLHRGLVSGLVLVAAAGGFLGRRADRGNPVWVFAALAALATAWIGLAKDVARGELQYLLPLFPCAAIGAAGIARWAGRAVAGPVLAALAALMIIVRVAGAGPLDRSRYYLMHDATENTLASLPDGPSTVLCFGDYDYDALRWRQIGWGERPGAALVHLRIVLLAPAHGDHLAEVRRSYPGFVAPAGRVASPAALDALAAAVVRENRRRGPVFAESSDLMPGDFWVRLRAIPSCADGFVRRFGPPCPVPAAQTRRLRRFRFRGAWDPSLAHDRWDTTLAGDIRAAVATSGGSR